MSFSKVTKGESGDAYLLGDPSGAGISGAFSGTTTPIVSSQDQTSDFDGLSLHLIVDYQQDPVAVIAGTDAVVASTGVWTFGNYTFTGLVGAKLVVSGAANVGNNGTFAITAVSGHTATTATTGLVNETFGPNVVVFITRSEAASVPQGTWTIQGSNDFVSNASGPTYGQPVQTGHYTDISSLFSTGAAPLPAVANVTDAGSMIAQPAGHFSIRHFRATFTPSAGKGVARVARFAKNWAK